MLGSQFRFIASQRLLSLDLQLITQISGTCGGKILQSYFDTDTETATETTQRLLEKLFTFKTQTLNNGSERMILLLPGSMFSIEFSSVELILVVVNRLYIQTNSLKK